MGEGPEEACWIDELRWNPSCDWRFDERKIGTAVKKILNDGFVFFRRNGADAVDEAAARPDAIRGASEQTFLDLHAVVEILRGEPPADLRVPPDRAEARAGGV